MSDIVDITDFYAFHKGNAVTNKTNYRPESIDLTAAMKLKVCIKKKRGLYGLPNVVLPHTRKNLDPGQKFRVHSLHLHTEQKLQHSELLPLHVFVRYDSTPCFNYQSI